MEVQQVTSFVLLPQGEWDHLRAVQLQILEALQDLQENRAKPTGPAPYLTAVEFMRAVKICRSKFDQLAAGSKIKVIKKKRKLYVPLSEVERYFTDATIE